MAAMPDRTYRATITRVVAGEGLYVIVPKLGVGVEYGPCQRLSNGGGTIGYVQGAAVLVTTVNGVPEDLVVLGTLA